MDIATQDFVPYLPGMASTGANACFQNVPLVEAFGMQNQTNFQAQVDEKLADMQDQDIGESFGAVSAPINNITELIEDMDLSELFTGLNALTNFVGKKDADSTDQALVAVFCPFDFALADENMQIPWEGKIGNAGWTNAGNAFTADLIGLARDGTETNNAYMARVFTIGGICGLGSNEHINNGVIGEGIPPDAPNAISTDGSNTPVCEPDCSNNPQCDTDCRSYTAQPADCGGANPFTYDKFNPDGSVIPGQTPALSNSYCTTGADCVFRPCVAFISGPDAETPGLISGTGDLVGLYPVTVNLLEMQRDMLLDLGTTETKGVAPSSRFLALGYTQNVFGLLDSYQGKLQNTFDSLLGIVNTAVGDILQQISNFLCNVNCGFVGALWGDVYNDICVSMLGGLLQISLSLWLLAVFMFFSSVLGAILVVRMRGIAVDEALEGEGGVSESGEESVDGLEMKSVSLDLYN